MPARPTITRRRSGPPRRMSAVAATVLAGLTTAGLLAIVLLVAPLSPADAGGGKSGAAGRAGATRFDVGIEAWDLAADGHCAVGRLHLGGRWRVVTTDCSHAPRSQGTGSAYYSASGTVSAAACISGHGYSGSTCHYGSLRVPFGKVTLGNVP